MTFATRVTEPSQGPLLAGETPERQRIIRGLVGLCDAARSEPDAERAAAMRADADTLVAALNSERTLTVDEARRTLMARQR